MENYYLKFRKEIENLLNETNSEMEINEKVNLVTGLVRLETKDKNEFKRMLNIIKERNYDCGTYERPETHNYTYKQLMSNPEKMMNPEITYEITILPE